MFGKIGAWKRKKTIALHSRVTVELVDSFGEAERREFILVTARQA